MPAPIRRNAREATKFGAIYFGSTSVAMDEAIGALQRTGIHLDTLRLRAYPFTDEVIDFIRDHERVFLVEQNRDAQLRTMLLDTGRVDPARIVPVLHYDGTPITARFIASDIARRMQEFGRSAIRAVAS